MGSKAEMLFNINSFLILMFLISFFINRASNNGIFFGIRFPREYLDNEELKNIEKYHRIIVSVVFAILIAVFNFIPFAVDLSVGMRMGIYTAMLIVMSLMSIFLIYIPFYFKVKKIKKDKGWTYKTKNIVVTDTTLRKPQKGEKIKPISSLWFISLLLIPFVLSILTMMKYNSLPNTIYGGNIGLGTFEKHTVGGFLKLYSMIISQVGIIIFLFVVNNVSLNSRNDLKSGEIEKAVIRKKKFKRLASIFMFVITLDVVIMMAYYQASLLYGLDVEAFSQLYTVFTAIVMMAFIIQFIKIGQGGRNIDMDKKEKDELYRDDDKNWILGQLYFNRHDPAWMVEKRTGIGWTINFGNPKSLIIFLAVLVIMMLIKYLIKAIV